MSVFDQLDDDEIPDVVRTFHRERRVYLEMETRRTMIRGGPPCDADPSAYWRATQNLTTEVERRGGRWDVGRLIYRVDAKGLWIEQAPAQAPNEGAGVGAVSVSTPNDGGMTP